MLDLRPYQDRAIRQVLAYAAEHPTGRVLLVIPPRGGKTLVGAHLVLRMAVRRGLRALWVVHREELLDEAVAHLIEAGIHPASIGVLKAKRRADLSAKVQVASEGTLFARQLRPPAHVVVTDESHRDTAPGRRRLRRAYPHAFLLGLTATPKAPAQRDLGDDYDTLMVVVQPSELIHDGYLACPTVFAPKPESVPDLRGLRLVGGDFRADDLEPLVLHDALLDAQVAEWARLAGGRRSLAFPVTQRHSRALVAKLQARGVRAEHLDGDTPGDLRRAIIAQLRAGELQIVSSVDVLSEGTNLPEVKCVLGVRPTWSLRLFVQQSMRCATLWGTRRPFILDTVGNVYRWGFPFEDRKWSLKNAESGMPVNGASAAVVKHCAHCGAVMPGGARACENCKRVFPVLAPVIPQTALTLHEVSPEARELNRERAQLLDFARGRAFKDPEGWVDDVLAMKYGHNNHGEERASA